MKTSLLQERKYHEENVCSGRCKTIVRKIVEQVRAETEQWSQMQYMLGQVKEEMEELQASRDFWEDRALEADDCIQSLQSSVQEWRQKACYSDTKVTELQKQISELRGELERLRTERNMEIMRTKGLPPIPRDSQKEKEKRVLICRLKENYHNGGNCTKQKEVPDDGMRRLHACSSRLVASKRSPFRDIGNSLPISRQSSRAVSPLYCPESSYSAESL
ncbi:hypothetical protein HHK36_017758 [Tetracentron sinense]|uniref:Uncharacterized protein n=1 Tax=Tetracentron sinense TaxID=13715 RepID=A0A834YYG6_TETSI|nr:hypothetical protein HHK36_017758 [Tetracentron sinense]